MPEPCGSWRTHWLCRSSRGVSLSRRCGKVYLRDILKCPLVAPLSSLTAPVSLTGAVVFLGYPQPVEEPQLSQVKHPPVGRIWSPHEEHVIVGACRRGTPFLLC